MTIKSPLRGEKIMFVDIFTHRWILQILGAKVENK